MAQVLRSVDQSDHPELLVGSDTGDDAAVWQRPDGRALVATADFFTPIVDDAYTWGRIAAANAVSDVYAMGGTPLFALNLVAWPREQLPLELLGEVMAGGSSIAREAGYAVAGGHTVDGPEPMYGQSVTGELDPGRMLTNAGLRVGDQLILTKPLGTGVLATAVKRYDPSAVADGGPLRAGYLAGVAEMTRLNADAARIALDVGATGATDVTGFGLLGHLQRMTTSSAVNATIEVASVPLLTGTRDLVADNVIPGGTMRNLEYVTPHVRDTRASDGSANDDDLIVLADAQTSGGLVFGCPTDRVDAALAALAETGHTAAHIGHASAADADGSGVISLV